MRKFACVLLVVVGASGSLGATMLISQSQAAVAAALEELKLERVPAQNALLGAPSTFKISKQTLEHMEKLMNDGKSLTVRANGQVVVGDAPGN